MEGPTGQKGSLSMSRAPNSFPSLVAAARAGDPSAIDQLLAAHRMGVYRCGLKVCRTTEDTEDAVQETLWAATRAIRSFRGTASSVVSWLFTIVRRECARLLERRRRAPQSLSGLEDVLHSREGQEGEEVRLDALAAAIADLDPLHREVVLLRDVQGLTAPEAAARLGITVPALKSRLHRARASLHDLVIRRRAAMPV